VVANDALLAVAAKLDVVVKLDDKADEANDADVATLADSESLMFALPIPVDNIAVPATLPENVTTVVCAVGETIDAGIITELPE
jgi:hypothetical protein